MFRFRFPIVVAAALASAGLAAGPAALAVAGPGTPAASGSAWTSSVPFTNQVASSPTTGGGYPVPPGQTFPHPGTLRARSLRPKHSQPWNAGEPGPHDPIGNSQ